MIFEVVRVVLVWHDNAIAATLEASYTIVTIMFLDGIDCCRRIFSLEHNIRTRLVHVIVTFPLLQSFSFSCLPFAIGPCKTDKINLSFFSSCALLASVINILP